MGRVDNLSSYAFGMVTALRRDAAHNRDQILRAARAMVDGGQPLVLNDVAKRAGVGVGTTYRNFPTPTSLLEAVAQPRLAALVAAGERALHDDEPGSAFSSFLSTIVRAQIIDASLPPVNAAVHDELEETTQLKVRLREVGAELLDRAKRAGDIRDDLAYGDVVPLACGLAHAVRAGAPGDPLDAADRYTRMLLGGLHP